MKVVTSVTTFTDAVGIRMSITYSEVDEDNAKVVSDNNRIDRIITDNEVKAHALALEEYAQSFVEVE